VGQKKLPKVGQRGGAERSTGKPLGSAEGEFKEGQQWGGLFWETEVSTSSWACLAAGGSVGLGLAGERAGWLSEDSTCTAGLTGTGREEHGA
jgi:hypothetical protein